MPSSSCDEIMNNQHMPDAFQRKYASFSFYKVTLIMDTKASNQTVSINSRCCVLFRLEYSKKVRIDALLSVVSVNNSQPVISTKDNQAKTLNIYLTRNVPKSQSDSGHYDHWACPVQTETESLLTYQNSGYTPEHDAVEKQRSTWMTTDIEMLRDLTVGAIKTSTNRCTRCLSCMCAFNLQTTCHGLNVSCCNWNGEEWSFIPWQFRCMTFDRVSEVCKLISFVSV